LNPHEKVWQIVKFSNSPIGYGYKGYKIKVGDVIKFGRVRFKVILFHTS
jgi:hypothetical protein